MLRSDIVKLFKVAQVLEDDIKGVIFYLLFLSAEANSLESILKHKVQRENYPQKKTEVALTSTRTAASTSRRRSTSSTPSTRTASPRTSRTGSKTSRPA